MGWRIATCVLGALIVFMMALQLEWTNQARWAARHAAVAAEMNLYDRCPDPHRDGMPDYWWDWE